MSDFNRATTIRKTRKAYACFWCRTVLAIGSTAVMVSGKWEGEFGRIHVHQECNDAWLRDPCNTDGEGCPYEHYRGMACDEVEDRRIQRFTIREGVE